MLEGVNATRSRKELRIPVVLSKDEVKQILILIDGTAGLVVKVCMQVDCVKVGKGYVIATNSFALVG